MRPLRYSINVTLDGCCDHREMIADEDLHRHAMENIVQADALLFGRVTYEMMEAAWRLATRTVAMPDWTEPFARTIDAAKKYVVSSTLDRVDWNAELIRGDLGQAVQQRSRVSSSSSPSKLRAKRRVRIVVTLSRAGRQSEGQVPTRHAALGHRQRLLEISCQIRSRTAARAIQIRMRPVSPLATFQQRHQSVEYAGFRMWPRPKWLCSGISANREDARRTAGLGCDPDHRSARARDSGSPWLTPSSDAAYMCARRNGAVEEGMEVSNGSNNGAVICALLGRYGA